MKKLLVILVSLFIVLGMTACAQNTQPEVKPEPEPEPAPAPVDENKPLTYAEYAAIPADGSTTVRIQAYVQAAQSYWDGGASLYLQDKDGGYFAYAAKMSEEDFNKMFDAAPSNDGYVGLANGMKVIVEGDKSEWSGEVEIMDGVVTLVDDGDKWLAEAADVTVDLGTDKLAEYANQRIKCTDLTVAVSKDGEGKEAAFLYSWDGSGEAGSDLYFNAEKDGQVYTFVVESYLCGDGSEVYETVESLKVGDVLDLEGFLYWYETAQPHLVSVTVK